MSDKTGTITITERESKIILRALKKSPISGPLDEIAKFMQEVGDLMVLIEAPFKEEKKGEDLGVTAEIVEEGKSGRRKKRSKK